MCIQPVKYVLAKYMEKIWVYIYIYVLICLIEIIHRLEGSGVFFFFFFLQNKNGTLSLFDILTRKKMTLIQYIRTKQTYTHTQRQWSIHMTTRKRKWRARLQEERGKQILNDYQFINEKSTSAWRLNGNDWLSAWH
jgi:hypothetical protein